MLLYAVSSGSGRLTVEKDLDKIVRQHQNQPADGEANPHD
jgi:hypothetical protein